MISAYAILFGGALLLGGRLADIFGRRRLFMVGLAIFSGPRCCAACPGRRAR